MTDSTTQPSRTDLNSKKILYLITVSESGGAQKYVHDLTQQAMVQFQKVYLIYGGQGQGEAFKDLPQNIEQQMWPELVRSINPWNDLKSFLKLMNFLKKNKIDVLHANSSKAGFLGRLAAKICKVPQIVYTVHGYVFREPLAVGIQSLYWLMEYLAAGWTHVQISVNREDAEYTKKIFHAKKVEWIPNGIAVTDVDPELKLALQKKWRMQSGQKRIGTVANFYASKNHAGFLKTFKALCEIDSDLHWFIVGDGPLRREFEKKAHDLNLQDSVHTLGYQKNIPEFLSSVDLFVLPSLKEGLPYTILEAMAYGVPVVAAAVGGVRDVIQDGLNGWYLKSQSADAVQQILDILNHKNQKQTQQEMIQKAYQDFETNYALNKMLQKTIQTYSLNS